MTKTQHRARHCLLAGILIVAFGSLAAAQSRQNDPFASKLPDGDGKQAVLEFCAGACHLSDRLINAHKTAEEWRKTVLQMVSNGAQLFPEDIDTVTKYLAANLSSSAPASATK